MEVEYSDKPEWGPLIVEHLQSQMLLHGLLLALAFVVWLVELFVASAQYDIAMRWLDMIA